MNPLRLGVSLLFALLLSTNASAQKDYINTADQAFAQNTYYTAIDYYKKGYARLRNDVVEKARVLFQIGQCYRLMTDAEQAEVWYKKAVKAKYDDPLVLLYLGDVLKEQGKYAEAIVNYEKYEMQVPEDLRGPSGVRSCKLAVSWQEEGSRWEVEPEYLLNSKFFDFAPAWGLGRGHSMIIFASGRESSTGDGMDGISGENFQDLYFAERDKKGKWSEPKLLPGAVNTEANEGAACLNKKRNTLFFTRCPVEKNANLGCEIFVARKKGNNWAEGELIPLKQGLADSVSVGHPAITPDDQVLIFASDMPGGYGGKDLWMSTYDKKSRSWSAPVNLGEAINTPQDELFPYVHPDGTLYFSSNGHDGMGGLDIFKAKQIEGAWTWGSTENMKFPINSNGHDYGIVFEPDHDRGFLTSSRKGGKGQDDIFGFFLPPINVLVDVYVKDFETQAPIANATLLLTGTDNQSYQVQTDENGFFHFDQNVNLKPYFVLNHNYSLEVRKDDHFIVTDVVSTHHIETSTHFVKEIFLKKLALDTAYEFPEVQYPFDEATLLVEEGKIDSRDSLDYLYELLVQNPTLVVELQAHTDTRGDADYNKRLSQDRAQTCVDYLIGKGIDPRRLIAVGKGLDYPRITDEEIEKLVTEEEREAAHQINRRTEFVVVRVNFKD